LLHGALSTNRAFEGWKPEDIQSIKAPTLVLIGDSDIVRPEHAVQLFRLRGGGADRDAARLPESQLAVLPGTTHLTLVARADWLISMFDLVQRCPAREGRRRPPRNGGAAHDGKTILAVQ
jgi:pimeloyl-ACP methyl ester carboxylesterase